MTPAQLATLKAYITADSVLLANWVSGNESPIVASLNGPDASNTQVWWSNTPTDAIFNAITWANFTSNDPVPTVDTLSVMIYQTRAIAIQTKQMNLQAMLIGRQTLNAGYQHIRDGLRDAVIQLPSGAAGALISAGGASGVTVLTACLRPALANRVEKLFSAGPATTGTVTADVLVFEGGVGFTDIETAMRS